MKGMSQFVLLDALPVSSSNCTRTRGSAIAPARTHTISFQTMHRGHSFSCTQKNVP
jgi:hypothetical protein